jgi:ATP-binding cassette subfamily B (MDR/TAP) protein 1
MNFELIEDLHTIACQDAKDTYVDPETGYQVLTSDAHLRRGSCCGNSCRHCPFAHINVDGATSDDKQIKEPVLMNWTNAIDELDILFWSGGKDSLLTLIQLQEEKRNVILMTTFGVNTNRVSIQNIDIKDIHKQSQFLKIPICLVPLYPNIDYKQSVQKALDFISEKTGLVIKRLVFGDLHLQDIRRWRIDTWSDYEVATPLFNVAYPDLLERLWAIQAKLNLDITLSTQVKLGSEILQEGTPYTAELVTRLMQNGLDAMLENGEGHTVVMQR